MCPALSPSPALIAEEAPDFADNSFLLKPMIAALCLNEIFQNPEAVRRPPILDRPTSWFTRQHRAADERLSNPRLFPSFNSDADLLERVLLPSLLQ